MLGKSPDLGKHTFYQRRAYGAPGSKGVCISMQRWAAYESGGAITILLLGRSMPPTEAGEETQGALEGGTDDKAGGHVAYPVRQQHNKCGDENGYDAPSRVALPRRQFGDGRCECANMDRMSRWKSIERLTREGHASVRRSGTT